MRHPSSRPLPFGGLSAAAGRRALPPRLGFLAALFAAALFAAPAIGAQDFSGSLLTRLGWHWSASDLAPETQVLEAGVEGKMGGEENPSGQYRARLRLDYNPVGATTAAALGEAWIKLYEGPFDLSFGNQLVAWSVSDAFSPSDVVNPLDLNLPVDPEKIPVPLARAVFSAGAFSLDALAQPFWVAGELPGSPWVQAYPAGVPVTPHSPSFAWENVAYGAHAKASFELLDGLDLGATFYRGYRSTPRPVIHLDQSYQLVGVDLVYDRQTVLGADLVLAPGGGLLLKAEWVYTSLNDSSLLEPVADKAAVEGVSGLEYRLGPVQLIGEHVLDWARNSGGDELRQSAVLILSSDLGTRLSAKLAAVYDFSGSGAGMVTPQLSYTLADGLSLGAKAYVFFGDAGASYRALGVTEPSYGSWKDNGLGRISLSYAF